MWIALGGCRGSRLDGWWVEEMYFCKSAAADVV